MGRRSGSNVFLIGYRCAGKSSVGQSLAMKLGWPFIDTDSFVVSESGLSIKEVVDTCGWEAFRRFEHTALQQVCAMDRRVVATGGGIVLDAGNIELMKESGRIIWLRASPATIKARMVLDQDSAAFRPALTPKDLLAEIEETLANRESLYERAMDFAVDTDYCKVDQICDAIIGKLKQMDSRNSS